MLEEAVAIRARVERQNPTQEGVAQPEQLCDLLVNCNSVDNIAQR